MSLLRLVSGPAKTSSSGDLLDVASDPNRTASSLKGRFIKIGPRAAIAGERGQKDPPAALLSSRAPYRCRNLNGTLGRCVDGARAVLSLCRHRCLHYPRLLPASLNAEQRRACNATPLEAHFGLALLILLITARIIETAFDASLRYPTRFRQCIVLLSRLLYCSFHLPSFSPVRSRSSR